MRQFIHVPSSARGNRLQYMQQVHRFISPAGRPGAQIPGQEVGGIGLKHESVVGNLGHQFAQMHTSSFITNPARDTDIQTQVQVGMQFLGLTGKTMRHCA